jgi:hypothetical protein
MLVCLEIQFLSMSCFQHCLSRYLEVGRDLLTSVKKTEDSLLKLNLGRRSALNVTGGMSDDNKIRLQLSLDIEVFLAQVSST